MSDQTVPIDAIRWPKTAEKGKSYTNAVSVVMFFYLE